MNANNYQMWAAFVLVAIALVSFLMRIGGNQNADEIQHLQQTIGVLGLLFMAAHYFDNSGKGK